MAGMVGLWNYSNTPGHAAPTPVVLTGDAILASLPADWKLIMFVHPHCPCSRASMGELARVMKQGSGKIDAVAFFYRPHGEPESWCHTDLWNQAQAIPGVRVAVDTEGNEARRFGALNSGQVVLYDSEGHLSFKGGITSARGHEGDNQGRSAIVSLIRQGTSKRQETPTFGCRIFENEQNYAAGEISWRD